MANCSGWSRNPAPMSIALTETCRGWLIRNRGTPNSLISISKRVASSRRVCWRRQSRARSIFSPPKFFIQPRNEFALRQEVSNSHFYQPAAVGRAKACTKNRAVGCPAFRLSPLKMRIAGKKWFTWPRLACLIVTGVILFLIFRQIGSATFLTTLRQTRPGWLLLAFLAYGLAIWLGSLRWHVAVRLTARAIHLSASSRLFLIGP